MFRGFQNGNNRRPSEPYDGVLPEDHPERYEIFRSRRCMVQCEDVPLFFVRVTDPTGAWCLPCFAPARRRDNHIIEVYAYFHQMVSNQRTEYRCSVCDKRLTRIRSIASCGDCTDDLLPDFE